MKKTTITAGTLLKLQKKYVRVLVDVEMEALTQKQVLAARARERWERAGPEARAAAGARLTQKKRGKAVVSPAATGKQVARVAIKQTQEPREQGGKIDWENQDWTMGPHSLAKKLGVTLMEVQRAYDILMRGGKV